MSSPGSARVAGSRLWLSLVLAPFVLAMPRPGGAEIIILNNGLAPPNPANVLAGDASGDDYFVQNVGCNRLIDPVCVSPGAPTTLEIDDGATWRSFTAFETSEVIVRGGTGELGFSAEGSASVGVEGGTFGAGAALHDDASLTMTGGSIVGSLVAFGEASIDLDGGRVALRLNARHESHIELGGAASVGDLIANETASVRMSGGAVRDDLAVFEMASILVTGGTVGDRIVAGHAGTIRIRGHGFSLNGSPIPLGAVEAAEGTLTGTLASGEALDNPFVRQTAARLLLVPEPSGPALLAGLIVPGMLLRGRSIPGRARRRDRPTAP